MLYHINPATGEVGFCQFQPCRYEGRTEHYADLEEAVLAGAELMEEKRRTILAPLPEDAGTEDVVKLLVDTLEASGEPEYASDAAAALASRTSREAHRMKIEEIFAKSGDVAVEVADEIVSSEGVLSSLAAIRALEGYRALLSMHKQEYTVGEVDEKVTELWSNWQSQADEEIRTICSVILEHAKVVGAEEAWRSSEHITELVTSEVSREVAEDAINGTHLALEKFSAKLG